VPGVAYQKDGLGEIEGGKMGMKGNVDDSVAQVNLVVAEAAAFAAEEDAAAVPLLGVLCELTGGLVDIEGWFVLVADTAGGSEGAVQVV